MKLLAVTATRAEWGLLAPVLDALRGDARFTPQLLVTGQHLVAGSTTLAAITAEGHQPAALIDMELGTDDGPRAISHSMGLLVDKVGKVFADLAPDAVLLLGDRYESLAVALAALVARIPVVHVFGGDVTEGAFDDSIRHAITKLAALHFVSNEESAARVRQLGEDPARVHNVGSTGIDRILAIKTLSRADFFQAVGLRPRDKNFVLTFHPATLVEDPAEEARALLAALDAFPEAGLIFTGSNADPGAREIDALIQSFVAGRDNAVFFESLGSQRYFSALAHCDLVIGNSSSGIMEAPSFNLPTINIGDRQARRMRAQSVIDCAATPAAIQEAIHRGLSLDCSGFDNPYGDGRAARHIVDTLAKIDTPRSLTRKSFVDLPL